MDYLVCMILWLQYIIAYCVQCNTAFCKSVLILCEDNLMSLCSEVSFNHEGSLNEHLKSLCRVYHNILIHLYHPHLQHLHNGWHWQQYLEYHLTAKRLNVKMLSLAQCDFAVCIITRTVMSNTACWVKTR